MTLAELQGYVRLFVDKGSPLMNLLQQLSIDRTPYTASLLNAFVGASQRRPASGYAAAGLSAAFEALSEREVEVLALIAEGLTNQQIAERLVISIGTVKTHIKSILHKLHASNRTQAVAQARRFHLLSPD